ncbi:proton-coupled zinc antiporter SLC30A1-like [Convolutriloba macropyga]|uniref:proton-coupled zinc antiporter SLC30A1-like n=1 Tax=Convolutriloba macropyga TaxID=536237 RepID=UPI003F522847
MHLHDGIVSFVSLASRLVGSESTSRNTFGWVRVEPMGELVAAVFVMSLSCGVLPHVMRMVVEGVRVQHLDTMLYVLLASTVVRLTGLYLTFEMHRKHMTRKVAKRTIGVRTENSVNSARQQYSCHYSAVKCQVQFKHASAAINNQKSTSKAIAKPSVITGKSPLLPVIPESPSTEIEEISYAENFSLRKTVVHLQAHLCSVVFGLVVLVVLSEGRRTSLTIGSIPSDLFLQSVEQCTGVLITVINCLRVCPVLVRISMVFIQSVPQSIDMNYLKKRLANVHNVTGVHELHIWRLSVGGERDESHLLCHMHVTMKHISHFSQVERDIRAILRDMSVNLVTIQPEPEGVPCSAGVVTGQVKERAGGVLNKCLLDCPPESINSCRQRQCCGGKVNPYIDIAQFRRRSESISIVEHHLLKRLPVRMSSPRCHHNNQQQHHHHHHQNQCRHGDVECGGGGGRGGGG